MSHFLANNVLHLDPPPAVTDALATLDAYFSSIPAHGAPPHKRGRTMGPRAEAFCRYTLGVLQQNPGTLPGRISLPDTLAKLAAFDQMRPQVEHLTQVLARALDARFVLGHDLFLVAREGYNQLRRQGRAEGLQEACAELAQLFKRAGAQSKARRQASAALPPAPAADAGT
jgi:hypothetical protein